MNKQFIVFVFLLASFSAGCAGKRFKRYGTSPYTRNVCSEIVEQVYDKDRFTGFTQVVVEDNRDVCTKTLVRKLRKEGIAVVAPSAVEGQSNPEVTLYADSMGHGLFATRLAIKNSEETHSYSQLYKITSAKRKPNKVTVASLGVHAKGVY